MSRSNTSNKSKKSRLARARNFSSRFPVLEPLEARQLLSAAATFTNVGVGGGGGMYKPRISPFNPADVYISSDQGELFYSSNFGQSWTTVNFQQAIGGQHNPIQFTNNSNILYSIQNTEAVSKSTDSGQTWNVVPGWSTAGGGEGFALQIQGDLTNSNILFVTTATNIYESTNGGTTFTALTGLTYATGSQPYIAGEFNNGTNIYLGTSAGLLIFNETSSSWTAGPSGILSGYAMVSMTGAVSGGTTRLATVVTTSSLVNPAMDDYTGFTYSSDLAPFTLDVGGSNTWVQKNTTFFGTGSTTGQYAAYIQMVTGDINTIIASGTDQTGAVQIYKSTNGGTTWTAMMQLPATNIQTGSSSDIGASFGGGAQGLAVDPANASYIMVSNNVGDWASTNGGTTWQEVSDSPGTLAPVTQPYNHAAYSSTLNPTSVWGLTFINQQTIFANFTDIVGVRSTDGGNTWSYPNFGISNLNTIYNTSYDPRTGLLYGAFSNIHDMFTTNGYQDDQIISGGGGFIGVSSDMGVTWTKMDTISYTDSNGMLRTDPVVNVLVDPNVPNKVYALVSGAYDNLGGVYYTTNGGSSWNPLPGGDPPRTENHPWDIQELNNGNLLVTYGPTYNTTTGQQDASSGVYLWTASTSTWTDLLQNYNGTVNSYNPSGVDLQYNVRDVTIDPQDPTQQTYYISLYDETNMHGVHTNSGVWKTTNGGSTWTQIFSADGALSVTVNAATHEMYVASAATGVWYSSNANAAIPTFNQMAGEPFGSPTNIYIDPFNPNQIWVTTFGDGILVSNTTAPGLPGTPTGLTAQTLSSTQVKLTWSDNDVPTPQGYIIDQSTDGLTWTTVDTINSGGDLSAIIGGLTANTAYYFRVKAFSAAGNTVPDDLLNALGNVITVTTDSGTGLLAYDEFTYSNIGATLSGGTNGSGGSGWTSNWSGPTSGSTVINSGNLAEYVTNPGGTLTTSGNSVAETQQGIGDTRTTTATIGSTGTVFWASVLLTVNGPISLNIGTGSAMLSFGVDNSNNWYLAANGRFEGTPTAVATTGHTYLAVIRVDNETSTTKYAMWIDPILGATAPDYSASIIGNFTDTVSPFVATNTVSIGESGYSTTADIDEIRIGTTYASVTPHSAPAVPTAPTGLADTVVSTNEIDLTWTALASDQKGFHIQYSTNGSTYTTLDTINNASATSYTATNLAANTQYWFRVTGFNDTGDSTPSGVVTNTTLIAAPNQPTNLVVATTSSSSNFNLTWTDNATNETSYKVYYTTNARNSYGQATWTLATTLAANSTSYAVTGLSSNTLYYFKVSAVNSTAEVFSPIASGVIPAAPSGLTAVGVNPGQINLTWTDNSTLNTGYHLQISTDNTNWSALATITIPTANSYSVTSLAGNTQYYFRLTAFGPSGDSAFSNTAAGRTLATNTLIAAEDFGYALGSGSYLNGDNAGFGWNSAWSSTGGNGAYDVPIVSGSLTPPSPDSNLLVTGNSITQTQNEYSTRTTAQSFGGASTTTWVSFLMKSSTNTDGDVNLGNAEIGVSIGSKFGIIVNGNYLTSTMAVAANTPYFLVAEIIKPASGNETYLLWVNPTPGTTAPGTAAAIVNASANGNFVASHTFTLDTEGYGATVAYDEIRIGTNFSDVAPIAVPSAPSGLSATPVSSSQINLSWTNNSTTQTGLHVQRSTDGITFTTIATINTSTATTYSDPSLSSGTTYYYRVTGFNNTGDSLYSNPANATTQSGSTLIAYESFNYTPTTSPNGLNGSNGGTGWNSAWSTAGGNGAYSAPVVSGSLSAASPANTLSTTGNSVTQTSNAVSTRTTMQAFGGAGSTTWVSYLVKTSSDDEGSFDIGNAVIGIVNASDDWGIIANSGNNYLQSTTVAAPNTTYFIVAEIIKPTSGNETYLLWVNPTPGSTAPSTSSAALNNSTINGNFNSSNTIALGYESYTAVVGFDEIRLGTTYAAVAPVGVTAPPAPTGLVASPAGTSQINLSWTDDASNETGFNVYSSTNGTTFSLLQTINTANTSSYNVTNLSASTQYWFKVTDFNAGGESGYTGTVNVETQAAFEGFSYGNNVALNGQGTTGSGWTGAWSVTGDGINNVKTLSAGLTAPVNLQTQGGSLTTGIASGIATRTLSSSLNSIGSTVWTSFLVQPNTSASSSWGVIKIGNTQISYGEGSDDIYRWSLDSANQTWYGNHFNQNNTPVATNGQTFYVVVEQIFNGGADTIYAWINPTPGTTAPSTANAFESGSGNAGGSSSSITIESGYANPTAFGDFRIGTSYSAVAPVAPSALTGLTVNSANAANYSVHPYALATGVSQYGDQTDNFTTIPSQYLGATFISTAESDVTSTSSNLMTITVSRPVTLYVMFDDAITNKPSWLTSQFTDTGNNIITAQGTFSVYSVSLSAGSITLGGAGGLATQGMYSVFMI